MEYSDIAIVCIGRSGGKGQDLPRSGYGDDGSSHYLALSSEERELLKMLKNEGFQTTVLINTSYAMELGGSLRKKNMAYRQPCGSAALVLQAFLQLGRFWLEGYLLQAGLRILIPMI